MEKNEKKLVVANWKAYFAPARALKWCEEFKQNYRPVSGVEVIIAAPFLCIREVAERLASLDSVFLAAQSVSSWPQGSYTGSTPAAWLDGITQYSILGHRERRRYFHESAQDIARQVHESMAENLQPVVCVDKDNITAQTASFDMEEVLKILWAYTPPDADHLERAHGQKTIDKAVKALRTKVGGQEVLYGGGVNIHNARSILAIDGISGIMLGKGCLDAAAFSRLIESL